MRVGARIILFAAPLAVLPAATLVYTYLNIEKQLFVESLGCGCDSGFNANSLSLMVAGALLAGTALAWFFAAHDLPRRWFWAVSAGFIVFGAVFVERFMHYNSWL